MRTAPQEDTWVTDTNSPITVAVDGPVGVIRLARPDRYNCLSSQTFAAIDAARIAFEADPAVRAILLCADGKNFCTGAELTEVKSVRADAADLTAFIERGHAALMALEASSLPVVAAVQGLCLAGGLELVLACDIVFAAEGARFGDQHAQYGLVPGWGGSQRLMRTIGLRRGLDLCFSAEWITAERACDWGLVNQVVAPDALYAASLRYCMTLSERSRAGIALMKKLARDGLQADLASGLRQEIAAVVPALTSADVTEGLAAFEARRKPVFQS